MWEHDLPGGLRMLRMGIDTHLITAHEVLPLLIRNPGGLVVEMTDGTAEYNSTYRHDVGIYYDLVKAAVQRLTMASITSCARIGPRWWRSPRAGCGRR